MSNLVTPGAYALIVSFAPNNRSAVAVAVPQATLAGAQAIVAATVVSQTADTAEASVLAVAFATGLDDATPATEILVVDVYAPNERDQASVAVGVAPSASAAAIAAIAAAVDARTGLAMSAATYPYT